MTYTLTSMISTARVIGAGVSALFARPGLPAMVLAGGLIVAIVSLVMRLSIS